MTTIAEPDLFPGSDYEVPFPKVDGHNVTDLVLRLGGKLELNRNDPDHTAFIESLTLGRTVELRVVASVESKAQQLRGSEESEQTVFVVGLRMHSAEPA